MEGKSLKRKIFDELETVVDPELATSIIDLDLVDDIIINDSRIKVSMHLTSPYCPPAFGFKIAYEVRDKLIKIDGIENVELEVTGHFMGEAINNAVNTANKG